MPCVRANQMSTQVWNHHVSCGSFATALSRSRLLFVGVLCYPSSWRMHFTADSFYRSFFTPGVDSLSDPFSGTCLLSLTWTFLCQFCHIPEHSNSHVYLISLLVCHLSVLWFSLVPQCFFLCALSRLCSVISNLHHLYYSESHVSLHALLHLSTIACVCLVVDTTASNAVCESKSNQHTGLP